MSGCSDNHDPTPIRSFARTILAMRQIRQEPMLCVPTSAAMVMASYGDPRPPRLIKSLAANRHYDPNAPFNDFTITRYDDMITAAHDLGYTWVQRSFANNLSGFDDGLALIENQVRDGHPVLVDATLPSGHTFVVRGFDLTEQKLYVVDPDEPPPGRREITFDDFRGVWNEAAYGNDIRAMIVTQPRSSEPTYS